MFSIALKTLRANISRFVSTLIAIATGVAFLVAGNMLTTSISNSLGGEIDRQYADVDVAVVLGNSDLANFGMAGQEGVNIDLIDEIAEVEGVNAVLGEITGFTRFVEDGELTMSLTSMGGPTVRAWYDNDLNVATLEEGRAPTKAGEITLDRKTAKDRELSVGDSVELTSLNGAVDAEIVGITVFGTTDAPDQAGTVIASPDWAFELGANAENNFSRALVQGDGSISDGGLAERIRQTLPDSLTAVSGDTFRTDLREQYQAIFDILNPILIGFSLLALFVCAFVILNTFSVVVQQRTRELALMRAIAATPGQVGRSLRLEGLGIGFIGSVLGIVLGSLITLGIGTTMRVLDLPLPPASVVITKSIVIQAFAAGLIVTVLAVLIPAFRASRTAPVEAMREAAIERTGIGKVRLGFAVAFLAIGFALCMPKDGLMLGIGAFLFVIGVFLFGPTLAVLVSKATRPLLSMVGMEGRLSSENLGRNPKRTSTTTNALVIGVLLVTLVSVSGTSLKTTVLDYVEENTSTDAYVAAALGGIEESLINEMRAVDGVQTLLELKQIPVAADGIPLSVTTTSDLTVLDDFNVKLESGSWAELGSGAAVFTGDPSMQTSGSFEVTNVLGTVGTIEVTKLIENSFDAGSVGYVVTEETFEQLAPPNTPVNFLMINLDGTRNDAAMKDLGKISSGYGSIVVIEGNVFGQIIESVFNFLIAAVNALLGMSVVIALIGIVNTLTLSIFERRRELGLLRAVGMTRTEIRRMIRFEAVQISLLGTVVGLVSGTLIAWLLLRATELQSITISWVQIGGIFVLGLLLGVVASIAPTRRVSKLDILDSIKSE